MFRYKGASPIRIGAIVALLALLIAADDEPEAESSPEEAAETTTDEAGAEDEAIDPLDALTPSSRSAGATTRAGPGTWLPRAPRVAPGQPLAQALPPLSRVRAHLLAGDTTRARAEAERIVNGKRGRERDTAWFLLGTLHRDEGRHALAAEAFDRARASGGGLARVATWYAAEQELARNRPQAAFRLCGILRDRWKDDAHANDCIRVSALALAMLGREIDAQKAAKEYDELHPRAPVSEQVGLLLALHAADRDPQRGIPLLQRWATDFRSPLTGRIADDRLARLRERGQAAATVPDDTPSLQRRAVSLRESARRVDAWAAYEALRQRASDDPALQKWLLDTATSFGWKAHRFDFLVEVYRARYAVDGKPDDAWDVFRTLGRAGRWREAASWARTAVARHGTARPWRGKDEEIARSFLLAGAGNRVATSEEQGFLADARAMYDTVARRGGAAGRRAAFYAGFASYLAGDHDDALLRFEAVIATNRDQVLEAKYWRAKALEASGRVEEARMARADIAQRHRRSWYGVLVNGDAPEAAVEAPFARNGRWPGPELPPFPGESPWKADPDAPLGTSAWAPTAWMPGAIGFTALLWGGVSTPPPVPSTAPVFRDLLAPPPSYRDGLLFDRIAAEKNLNELITSHGTWAPELGAIRDLTAVGLYDLSGPMFAAFYERWRTLAQRRDAMARKVKLKPEDWRSLFFLVRDHHHTAKALARIPSGLPTAEDRRDAVQLGWPLAHDRYVWQHAREYDVDPYLVLGLMRQESTYSPIAVSPVGARGAMQIMPRTGHLMADLRRDTAFTAGDLEDPVLSVGYGIDYLGRLLDRFGGCAPLAVAAYNGGPHNVSAWLRGTGRDVPTDVFVELIPYRETRDYVKRVTGNYATYLTLYAPEGTAYRVPATPSLDDATIVDF